MTMKECPRDDEPNAVFHVTNRVNWQVWHLQPSECAAILTELIRTSLLKLNVDLLAYVLMSNHLHCVVRSPGEDDFQRLTKHRLPNRLRRRYPRGHLKRGVLSQFLHRLAGMSSRQIQRLLELKGRLWESDFYSTKLESADALLFAIAYDHLNPVAKDMARTAEQYGRSSAMWWQAEGSGDLPLARRGLPFSLDLPEFRKRLLALQRSRELRKFVRQQPNGEFWTPARSTSDLIELCSELGLERFLQQRCCG